MALNRIVVDSGNKKDFEAQNLPEGEHEGRLVYVADLGLQSRNFKGEEKPPAQQISLGIEIVGKHVTLGEEKVPRILWTNPFNIFRTMDEKGKELQFFKVFYPKAQADNVANWESVLGLPVSVTVINVKGKGENSNKVYDNIQSLAPIPAKYQADVPAAETEPGVGDAEDETNPVTAALFGLPKFVWAKRITTYAVAAPKPKTEKFVPEEEDVPF